MGCSGSKTDDLPLVVRCRERRELIRAAANHRYVLAAAHVSYFRSLKDVGDALRRFIDEELVAPSTSPSPPPISPPSSKLDVESLHLHDDDEEESDWCISDSSTDDDGDPEDMHHHDVEKSPSYYSGRVYYMKKSAPPPPHTKTAVPPQPHRGRSDSYWNSASGKYGGDEGVFTVTPARKTPPPPSPNPSALGFLSRFDVFDVFDGECVGLISSGDHEHAMNSVSPNSSKVMEKERFCKLGEETEHLVCREALKGKSSIKSSSKSAQLQKSESSARSVLSCGSEKSKSVEFVNPYGEQSPKGDMDETPRSVVSKRVSEGSMKKKKGAHSELERRSSGNAGSSRLSGVTVLSPHEARDLRDVVTEIRDDFEIASGYGKEVAMILEAGKVPYQPSFLKAILSRILYLTAPWLTFMDSPSIPSVTFASRSVKLAKSYFEDVGKEFGAKFGSLSSTLDKIYAWEKKLYKAVKDEEKLRIMYEKQRMRLKILDGVGAEPAKVCAAEVSLVRLLTKLDVRVREIDIISSRIHKLMDEELEPKIIALIQGMIGMWNAMLRCHQKQFEAISKSKMQNLRAKTGSQKSTITNLEKELRAWRRHFNDWIGLQKSYVESLNGWLQQFHEGEPGAAPYVPAPYSPGQLRAPPIFVICNDWHKAMESISDRRLSNAMNGFSAGLQKLRGKQDEEAQQRLRAEHVSNKYQKLMRSHRVERQRMKRGAPSKLNDVELNLDCLKQRLGEEKRKHDDTVKVAQNAACGSLQGGLIPIFKELDNFTVKALKSHQHIRLRHPVLQ
ncbi:protein ALTERED PHOSPHATE STARVATION RESPONSE 1-like [Salvia miltiorrhiza]|uniref:protein ALTERED PHOSPHATE STARVATION RESPONSE 1-like n=1 Tax=Salvia miltiorrhiza TaxID=226208 RepID=UPI0025AC675E|nr:protein ALTERED PHOSPHATE STARVATION RESPONSE 1-like [Salvia miltiorrhiza]